MTVLLILVYCTHSANFFTVIKFEMLKNKKVLIKEHNIISIFEKVTPVEEKQSEHLSGVAR